MILTLILKRDLDILKIYIRTKNAGPMWEGFRVYTLNRQTHRQRDEQTYKRTDITENVTYPHSRVVKIEFFIWDLVINTNTYDVQVYKYVYIFLRKLRSNSIPTL